MNGSDVDNVGGMTGGGNGIDGAVLQDRLVAPSGPYTRLTVVTSTGSTNADLMAAAQRGAPDREVLVAEEQTEGRGRQARRWESPAGSGIYLSVLLRPDRVPPQRWGTLAMVAGLALLRTVRAAGADAVLKWPNDLLAGPDRGKCAGVLAESVPPTRPLTAGGAHPAVVVGIGLNVTPLPADPPLAAGGLAATSLAEALPPSHSEAGARQTDRTELCAGLLGAFAELEGSWRAAGGDPAASGALAEYRDGCATIGTEVRVELPGRPPVTGTAEQVSDGGELLVRTGDGELVPVAAGDVVQLRQQ